MRELITRSLALLFVSAMIVSVIADRMDNTTVINARASVAADPNPLLADWEGPYGGVPPSALMKKRGFVSEARP